MRAIAWKLTRHVSDFWKKTFIYVHPHARILHSLLVGGKWVQGSIKVLSHHPAVLSEHDVLSLWEFHRRNSFPWNIYVGEWERESQTERGTVMTELAKRHTSFLYPTGNSGFSRASRDKRPRRVSLEYDVSSPFVRRAGHRTTGLAEPRWPSRKYFPGLRLFPYPIDSLRYRMENWVYVHFVLDKNIFELPYSTERN